MTDAPLNDPSPIAPGPTATATVIAAIEDNAELDRVVAALHGLAHQVGESPLGPVLRGEWLGHALHPLLTDLPIGCWTSATVLDVVGGHRARPAARRLVGLGLLTAVPTVAAGVVELALVDDERTARVATVHAAGNSVALGCYTASWVARRRHPVRGAIWALVGGTVATFTGFLGGHLAFARGVGHGIRGADQGSGHGAGPTADSIEEVVDLRGAADILQADTDRVLAMAEQGLLTPLPDDGAGPLFAAGEVRAARLIGG